MFRLTSLTYCLLLTGSAFATTNPVEQGAGAIGLIAKFRQWVTEHGKKYESEAEELLRLKVWTANHGKLVVCWTTTRQRLYFRCVGLVSRWYTLCYSKTGIFA